eukprot:366468-Chlamydomonas_euryale.AAC.5
MPRCHATGRFKARCTAPRCSITIAAPSVAHCAPRRRTHPRQLKILTFWSPRATEPSRAVLCLCQQRGAGPTAAAAAAAAAATADAGSADTLSGRRTLPNPPVGFRQNRAQNEEPPPRCV